jgi:hypothetical protein
VAAVLVLATLALVGGNAAGRDWLAAAVIVLQALLGLGWLLLVGASVEASVLVGFAVVAADVVLLRTRSATGGSIAGVLGLSVVAVLFYQLARRDERGVVRALAFTFSAIAFAVALALLLPLRELAEGRSTVFVGVVTAAAALAVARLVPGPAPLGFAGGLAVAAAVAVGCGLPAGGLSAPAALGLGLAAAAAALLIDRLLTRIAAQEAGRGQPQSYAAVLVPVMALLPLALASPIAYLAGRVIASGGG